MAPESLLVVQTAYLGDVVLTTPLLQALAAAWPQARIDVLVRADLAALLDDHPSGARPLPLDKRGADRGPLAALLAARRIGRRGYDLALSPHRSLRSALTLRLAGIERRVGFDNAQGARLYHRSVARDPAKHEVWRVLSLLDALEIPQPAAPQLSLGVGEQARAAVDRLLVAAGVQPGRALIGVNPASVWATKRWPAESFAALINRCVAEIDAQVLILGGPADRELCRGVAAMSARGVIDLSGRCDLAELKALIARLALYVTNDSGPMHVAVALNVPVLALFGSTTPEQGYAPFTANCEIVQREGLACRPCGPHGHDQCPLGHLECMRLITVDQAMAALLMLARRNGVI